MAVWDHHMAIRDLLGEYFHFKILKIAIKIKKLILPLPWLHLPLEEIFLYYLFGVIRDFQRQPYSPGPAKSNWNSGFYNNYRPEVRLHVLFFYGDNNSDLIDLSHLHLLHQGDISSGWSMTTVLQGSQTTAMGHQGYLILSMEEW